MKIGITGTRNGMTQLQKQLFKEAFSKVEIEVINHGDCVGADEDAHNIAILNENIKIETWPSNVGLRAYTSGADLIHEVKPPLERNKDIVDSSDILIAFPDDSKEKLRSGTWATVRYARKRNKPIIIIFPDGEVRREN